METIIKELSEYERELTVTAPWSMVSGDYYVSLKKYLKRAFNGHKAGQAPVGEVEAHFMPMLTLDVLAIWTRPLFLKAMIERGIDTAIAVKSLERELKKDEYMRFRMIFIVPPHISLPDYANMKLRSTGRKSRLEEASHWLLRSTHIDMPDVLVDVELRYSAKAGKKITESERKKASDRMKLIIILRQIGFNEGVEITNNEIVERIKLIAARSEVNYEQLFHFFIVNNAMWRMVDTFQAEKVLEYISCFQVP
ncbi:hypothetical protein FACS1894159_01060 [Bacteroidia bacterium]|nr:hypothetical protein FACS1894159_01060 [Bacteroidia bacterium]